MPEFIPKANTPDQLARYVLELRSNTPSNLQIIGEGVNSLASNLLESIRAKQKAQAAFDLKQQEINAQNVPTELRDPVTGELKQTVSGNRKVELLKQKPPSITMVDPTTGKPIYIGSSNEKVISAGRDNQWSYTGVSGMQFETFLKSNIGKEIQRKVSANEDLNEAEGKTLEDFGIKPEWNKATFYQKVKAWFKGESAPKTARLKGSMEPGFGQGSRVGGNSTNSATQPAPQRAPAQGPPGVE